MADKIEPSTAAAAAAKIFLAPCSCWPPSEFQRGGVRNFVAVTLSTINKETKAHGRISREEGMEAAKLIEQEAFQVAGDMVLEIYHKEVEKRRLEALRARSGDSAAAAKEKHVRILPDLTLKFD